MNETTNATKPYKVDDRAGNWFADFIVESRKERHAKSLALGISASECPNNLWPLLVEVA
jgi:hypothetical protein